jgi:pimeloyl-ACP methyl ester carboxylesterase
LNAGKLPPINSWADGARDILNFLRHCMPAADEEAGWALEWKERAPRKVFAVGHSLGGNECVQAAAAAPELFEGIFLVEPMVSPPYPHPADPRPSRRVRTTAPSPATWSRA